MIVRFAYVQMEDKEFYTIEDLVTIYSLLEKSEKNYNNLVQDTNAQTLKLENLESKVKNANIYIEEIASAFSNFDCSKIFLPKIEEQYLYKDTHKNREYEE